ncbi:MAG: hypothetical protein DWI21_12780, partial [Planctomycetota bacterium]
MDFVAIDLERANSQPRSSCAIGITPVKNGLIGETIYRLIRPPELEFDDFQIRMHGITANDVKDAPTLDQLWPEIAPQLIGTLVIAHSAASADMPMLKQSLQAVGVPVPAISFLCSRDLSRELWPKPNPPNHKLKTLCKFHSIPLKHHDAGSDARAAAQLILLGFKERGVLTSVENGGAGRPNLVALDRFVGNSVGQGNWSQFKDSGVLRRRSVV